MAILGAHMSTAGGFYKSVERANEAGCNCVQLFTKNNKQWKAKPITEEDARLFREALKEKQISHPLSHASYLINLANAEDEMRQKSIDAFVVELQRAEQLGIPCVVLHPGSCSTSDEETGLKLIAQSLDEVHATVGDIEAMCLLENTAGQGSQLGYDFEHLQKIIDLTTESERVGVCIDTCHAFSAGYSMATEEEYEATIEAMEESFGIDRIKAFHLNDSKKPFGERKDRHEAIGKGEMGLEPFRHLLNDARFQDVPMYLETPKEESGGIEWDMENLATLRSLVS